MINLYNVNGLMFWDDGEIAVRNHFRDTFARDFSKILKSTNKAWEFFPNRSPITNAIHSPKCWVWTI